MIGTGLVALNPPERAQVKRKYHPKVKAARTFRLLLRAWERQGLDGAGGRYCGYASLEGVKSALERIARETGIMASTYSLRHKVTTVLRKAAVPEDQISAILGHRRPSLRTTAGYGEYAPDYQKEGAAAIEAWFWSVVALTRKLMVELLPNPKVLPSMTTYGNTGLHKPMILFRNLERANGFEPSTLTLAKAVSCITAIYDRLRRLTLSI